MCYIHLSPDQHPQLTLLYKTSQAHREHQRAHALLLSSRHFSIAELSTLFEVDHWEQWMTDSQEPLDLQDQFRSGRPSTLSTDQKKRDRVGQDRNAPNPAGGRAH